MTYQTFFFQANGSLEMSTFYLEKKITLQMHALWKHKLNTIEKKMLLLYKIYSENGRGVMIPSCHDSIHNTNSQYDIIVILQDMW